MQMFAPKYVAALYDNKKQEGALGRSAWNSRGDNSRTKATGRLVGMNGLFNFGLADGCHYSLKNPGTPEPRLFPF